MKIIYIALLKIKMILRDKVCLAWMILAPIIFISIIVYGFNGVDSKCNIVIVDNDKSDESKEFIDLLDKNKEYPITVLDENQAKTNLVDGKSIAIVRIPKGFSNIISGKDSEKQVTIAKLRDNERIIAIENNLETNINKLKIKDIVGNESANTLSSIIPNISLEKKKEVSENIQNEYKNIMTSSKIVIDNIDAVQEDGGLDELSYSTIGIMVMFIIFFVVTSAGSIIDERKNGTWNRIKSTGTGKVKIILGYTLSLVIVGFIQVILLIIVGKYIYNVYWGNSLLALLLIFTSFVLSGASLGVLIATIAESRMQLTSLIAIIIMPTSLLGGCMWSKDMMSSFLLKISYLTPQSWVIDGIVDVINRGGNLATIYTSSCILILFAAIFFVITLGVLKLKQEV